MKDNEKKVKLTEEVKKEVQTEEEGVQLTDEELAQVNAGARAPGMAIVTGGSALGVKAGDTVVFEQSDALLTGPALKVD